MEMEKEEMSKVGDMRWYAIERDFGNEKIIKDERGPGLDSSRLWRMEPKAETMIHGGDCGAEHHRGRVLLTVIFFPCLSSFYIFCLVFALFFGNFSLLFSSSKTSPHFDSPIYPFVILYLLSIFLLFFVSRNLFLCWFYSLIYKHICMV